MSKFDGTTVLVTGATGMICSGLVEYLLENTTARVHALGRSRKKMEDLYAGHDRKRLFFLEQDVTSPIGIEEDVDYVFHGAGPIDSETIRSRPVDVILPNIQGLLNCGDIARRQMANGGRSPRIIVFSSATVYDVMPESGQMGEHRFREEDFLYTGNLESGNACYFESKRMSEVLAKALTRQYGMDAVICRLAYVYGAPHFKPNTAFYQFVDLLRERKDIVMNHSGLARRDNIYLEDAVLALVRVAESGTCGETYNVSSGCEGGNYAAIDEIAQTMIGIVNERNGSGLRLTYRQEASLERAVGIPLDNTKLKGLGWEVRTDLRLGLETVLRNYQVID